MSFSFVFLGLETKKYMMSHDNVTERKIHEKVKSAITKHTVMTNRKGQD
jgi:hypothetical protein